MQSLKQISSIVSDTEFYSKSARCDSRLI